MKKICLKLMLRDWGNCPHFGELGIFRKILVGQVVHMKCLGTINIFWEKHGDFIFASSCKFYFYNTGSVSNLVFICKTKIKFINQKYLSLFFCPRSYFKCYSLHVSREHYDLPWTISTWIFMSLITADFLSTSTHNLV